MLELKKYIAHFLSIITHPLLIIMYVLFLFLLVNPYLFPYRNGKEFGVIVLIVFFTSVAIPLVAILLLLSTGLLKSLQMEERTDRIGPLMITAISYLWLYLNIRTHNAIPSAFSSFVLGSIIAIFLAFFINNFSKISLHAVGLGGLFFAFVALVNKYGRPYISLELFNIEGVAIHILVLLIAIILVIGASLTSRLYLKAHTLQDVSGGFLVGVIGQIMAMKLFF